MARLRFHGEVTTGDSCRCAEEADAILGAIHIGGVDFVDEVNEQKWSETVRVTRTGPPLPRLAGDTPSTRRWMTTVSASGTAT